MTTFDNLSPAQYNIKVLLKLRASLHRDIRSICTETCHLMGLEISKTAMEVISELVYKKLSVYSTDLEAFAKHAKRTVVNADDVKLLVRRNPSLKNHLNSSLPTPKPTTAKDKRRKTVTLPVNKPDTPAPKTAEKDSSKPESSKDTDNMIPKENIVQKDTTTKPDDDAFEHMDISDTIVDLTFD